MSEHVLGYLASPYTHKDKYIMHMRFIQVCMVAGKLLEAGHKFYCPIAHTHPIADYGELPLDDHSLWLPFDEPILSRCDELWVVEMDGWRESTGIKFEMDFFKDRIIRFIDPDNPVASL